MLSNLILTLLFLWLGLYLLTRHRRGVPSWWAGLAFTGAGVYSLLYALFVCAVTDAMRVFLTRWIAFPAVATLVSFYALSLSLRYRERPIPRRPIIMAALIGALLSLLSALWPRLFRDIGALTNDPMQA